MATFFPNTDRSFFERIMIRLLRTGEIPTHIGFIMDGNRRYAKKLHVEKVIGHGRGFEKLAETLSWCRDLGITQATIYAFSIENFKRPPDEVDCLMTLFREQFDKLIEEFPKFDSYQICLRIYGKVDLLPLDIQKSIAKVVLSTAKNKKFFLNVCFAYTAREEIVNALTDLMECVTNGIIEESDITETTLSNTMYSLGMRDPDILLRTSGEIRLSDYLLWQTNFSYIAFIKDLWPDFSIWSFFGGVLHYQVECGAIKEAREEHESYLQQEDLQLCESVYQKHHSNGTHKNGKQINGFQSNFAPSALSLEQFIELRNKRIEKCWDYIRSKRLKKLRDLVKDVDLEDVFRQNDDCSDKINNNTISNGVDPQHKQWTR